MVTYTGDDGSEVTASWRLTDLVEWLTALGYDFGPDGPPPTPPRTSPPTTETRRPCGRRGGSGDRAGPPRPWTDRRCPSPSGAARSWLTRLGRPGAGPWSTAMRRSEPDPGARGHRAVGPPDPGPDRRRRRSPSALTATPEGGAGGEGRGAQRRAGVGGQQRGGEGAVQVELVDDAVERRWSPPGSCRPAVSATARGARSGRWPRPG